MRSLKGLGERFAVRIAGTGMGVPDKIVPNSVFAERLGVDPDWIERHLGIRERRRVVDETITDLCSVAGAQALERSGIAPDQIDLVVVCSVTRDRLAPSTACLVQNRLNIPRAAAFDLVAACSGFIYGLSTVSHAIINGAFRNALVIGGDVTSTASDFNHRDCVFFGDGAGAVVLTRSERSTPTIASMIKADGSRFDIFTVPPGEKFFRMNGRGVYETAMQELPPLVWSLLQEQELTQADIDFVVPHQPARALLQALAARMEIDFGKVKTNMDRYANTSAGSIPILLHELAEQNTFKTDDLILFLAIGAGMAWGSAVYVWH